MSRCTGRDRAAGGGAVGVATVPPRVAPADPGADAATVAVAAAVGLAAAAYNIAPVAGEAEFGTATSFFRFDEPRPEALQAKLEAGEEWFGAIDVIGHRSVSVPGSIETVDYRTQDPQGPFGAPMLDLRDGRFPLAADEIAVTDGVAETFALHIGAVFALDGVDRTVVGLVENPSRLDDEFALVVPSLVAASDSVLMFVDASDERVRRSGRPATPDATSPPEGTWRRTCSPP